MEKEYKAVVVCTYIEDGILFAKRADSKEQASHIIFDDLMRIMDDYECSVTLSNKRDGYGEWVTVAEYEINPNTDTKEVNEYKVCFDDEPEREDEE